MAFPLVLRQCWPHDCIRELFKKYKKINCTNCYEKKKQLPCVHTKLELGMLGNARKLVKDVIYLCRPIFFKMKIPLPTSYSNNKQPILGLKEL
jgi:hypothetical protein